MLCTLVCDIYNNRIGMQSEAVWCNKKNRICTPLICIPFSGKSPSRHDYFGMEKQWQDFKYTECMMVCVFVYVRKYTI